jgi:hypothetical protein
VKIHWPLVTIDVIMLLAFSYGGLKYHYEGDAIWAEVVRVILPFLLGFVIVAPPLKLWSLPKSGRVFLRRSAIICVLGMGAGLFLRGLQRGVMPDILFVKITLGFAAVCLLIGRGGYWLFRGRHLASES